MPSRQLLSRKCQWLTPSRATTALTISSPPPRQATSRQPKRSTSGPATNAGRNMPSMCHWMTWPLACRSRPSPCIARGVAFITRIIRPWPAAVVSTAARTVGRASSACQLTAAASARVAGFPEVDGSPAKTMNPSAARLAISR